MSRKDRIAAVMNVESCMSDGKDETVNYLGSKLTFIKNQK